MLQEVHDGAYARVGSELVRIHGLPAEMAAHAIVDSLRRQGVVAEARGAEVHIDQAATAALGRPRIVIACGSDSVEHHGL